MKVPGSVTIRADDKHNAFSGSLACESGVLGSFKVTIDYNKKNVSLSWTRTSSAVYPVQCMQCGMSLCY